MSIHRRSAGTPLIAMNLALTTLILGCAADSREGVASVPKGCVDEPNRVLCHVTPKGGIGYLRDRKIDVTNTLEAIFAELNAMPEKSIDVQLLTEGGPANPTVYQHKQGETWLGAYVVKNYQGEENRRLTVRGIKAADVWLTQIKGRPLDEITGTPDAAIFSALEKNVELPVAPAGAWDLDEYMSDLAAVEPEENLALMKAGVAAPKQTYCLDIRFSQFIVLQDLAFEDCWLSAVYTVEVRHLTVLRSRFVGSRDAIFAMAKSDPKQAHHYEIAGNEWTSDIGKQIWETIPWGVTHHGEHIARNGSLFASRNIAGNVRFHHNTIRYTYNGIRLVARKKKEYGCEEACIKQANKDVEIYANTFDHVRDNPIEPEGRAERWAISHNRFSNSYALISMDGVRDGPIYIWGNLGWSNGELPADDCQDTARWAHGVVYLFSAHAPGWARVDPAGEYDPFCATHRGGRVFKLGPLARSKAESESLPMTVKELPDLYVFHNSWHIRSPLFGGGLVRKLRHWNNAIQFTSCGSAGADHCRVMEPATEQPYGIYPTPDGMALYYNGFSIYDPAEVNEDDLGASSKLDYESHHNASNYGFPEISWLDQELKGSIPESPMFVAPDAGEFALASVSPALKAGCKVQYKSDKRKLECVPFGTEPAADIGAVQSNPQFGTPLFAFDPPVRDQSPEHVASTE
jgi:hypothetical protein